LSLISRFQQNEPQEIIILASSVVQISGDYILLVSSAADHVFRKMKVFSEQLKQSSEYFNKLFASISSEVYNILIKFKPDHKQ
jgi:hypothetical protein